MREVKVLVPKPCKWTLESKLAYLDKAGIALQLLSNLPKQLDALKYSNDYATSLVRKHVKI